MAALSLIHTADLHNRLTLATAQRLAELRQHYKALLLDSGDAIRASNVTVHFRDEQAIELMNTAGYAAMAVGNREYFFRKHGMIHKTKGAQFAVLNANIRSVRGSLGHIRPWTILTSPAGQRVGVLGLTRAMIAPGAWWEIFSDLRFVPWKRAVERVLAVLRGQVDWFVVLSHLGAQEDHHLAKLFPEIDIVLSGHAHPEESGVERVGPVLISRPAPYAQEALLLESVPTQGTKRFVSTVLSLS